MRYFIAYQQQQRTKEEEEVEKIYILIYFMEKGLVEKKKYVYEMEKELLNIFLLDSSHFHSTI